MGWPLASGSPAAGTEESATTTVSAAGAVSGTTATLALRLPDASADVGFKGLDPAGTFPGINEFPFGGTTEMGRIVWHGVFPVEDVLRTMRAPDRPKDEPHASSDSVVAKPTNSCRQQGFGFRGTSAAQNRKGQIAVWRGFL